MHPPPAFRAPEYGQPGPVMPPSGGGQVTIRIDQERGRARLSYRRPPPHHDLIVLTSVSR
jgi:hypothetical protein